MSRETATLTPSANDLDRAAQLLRAGGLVAFPTETVYGLGADATNDQAVARIFDAKARPRFNPLIVHVADLAMAQRFAVFDARAMQVAARFWPGPLTLVLPLRPDSGLSALVTAELPSVAIRLPAHPVATALLKAFGGPLAAPSANPSGRISPTRALHVLQGLSGRIDAVIDGGDCAVGLESTIVGLTGATATLLRPGGIPTEVLTAFLGPLGSFDAQGAPTAPGQLASHYAPQARLRLNAVAPEPGEKMIGFGAVQGDWTLSETGDLIEAAARLFHILRLADEAAGPAGSLAIAAVPEVHLGRAINDRLRRAAAPRT